MKIAIICPNYPPSSFEGGISHYSRLLAEQLSENGHTVYAIASSEFGMPLLEGENSDKINRINIQGPWNHRTVYELEKIIKQCKFDSVILQYSPASFKNSFRIKWALSNISAEKIITFHTLWGRGFDRIIGILNLIGSKIIIATNSEIMTILKKRLPFFLKKTYWIPISSNILQNTQRSNQNNDKIISYFGMLYPGKGLDLILDVLEVLNRKSYNFNFKFIGGGMLNHEQYEIKLGSKIKEKKLTNKVEQLGKISEDEVSRWLNSSRFVFLPYKRGLSDRRGSFMAALEHGKAVLSGPPVVEMPFLKNGENVLWPENPSLEEYIKLAEKLLVDDELITRLERGAKKLSSNFSWEKIAAAYESVFLR